jgi:membrane-associated phospholipid phosphatase
MSRGIGTVELVQGVVPDWAAAGVAVLTQLGDAWFLIALLGVLYWTQRDEQADIVLVGAALLAGAGLYRGLKFTFERPRPDQPLLDPATLGAVTQPLYEVTASASGYGFPSGHATSSAVVYFGLAAVLSVWTLRRRVAVAAVLVAVVSLTRVALGVHYLVDVVAGVALGGLLVVLSVPLLGRLTSDRETPLLVGAVLASGFYLAASGGETTAILLVGGTLGLLSGWQLVVLGRLTAGPDTPVRLERVRLGLAIASLLSLLLATAAFPLLSPEQYAVSAGGVVGFGVVVGVVVPVVRLHPGTWRHAVGRVRERLG